MPLTLANQRKLTKMLSESDKSRMKSTVVQMQGQGFSFSDIISKIKSVVNNPIVKEIGSTVLKEVVVPFVQRKMSGNGTQISGSGVRLAGRVRGNGKAKPKAKRGRKTLTLACN
jgi:hypothetical protein